MNAKVVLIAMLLVGAFLVGCTSTSSPNAYASYNQPQGQQQQGNQYVGGGCGVAPNADYTDGALQALNSKNSAL